MTREEYELKIEPSSVNDDDSRNEVLDKFFIFECNTNSYIYQLEQRNAELEQRIKELEESKTCEGCIHNSYKTSFGRWCNCSRNSSKDIYFDIVLHER